MLKYILKKYCISYKYRNKVKHNLKLPIHRVDLGMHFNAH